jgi:hypothetical protein
MIFLQIKHEPVKGKLSALFHSKQEENIRAQQSGKFQQKFIYKIYSVKTHELGEKNKQINVFVTCTFCSNSKSTKIV